MASNTRMLFDIISDRDLTDAMRWIDSADMDTNFGVKNEYNETLAQYAVLPIPDMPMIVLKLIDRMTLDDLNNRDNDNNALITSAVYYTLVVKKLLDVGVSPDTMNADEMTLFALAAELGDMDLVKLLVEKYNIDINAYSGNSALELSAMNKKHEMVKYLLEIGSELSDHFISSWGNKYIKELENYSNLESYYDLFTKYEMYDLVSPEVKEMFIF